MLTAAEILKAAQGAPPKNSLDAHLPTILTLRGKNFTWREIAAFLTEHGVPTDHSKVFRLASNHERQESETASFAVPSAARYVEALTALDSARRVSAPAKAMLGHHFAAHNRTVTYTQLARAAALAEGKDASQVTHRAANSTYGRLGRTLGEQLGMKFLPSDVRDKWFYSSSIGVGSSVTPNGGEFELVMHHELAKALTDLAWF